MAWPVVSKASGGIAVTLASNGIGTPYEEAANGIGTAVTWVASGGLPLVEGGGYEPEASALFARFTTPPDATRKSVINQLVKRLKAAGIWTRLDALWLYAAADAQAGRQNWIADLYNITPVSSPAFAADRGYTGDGAAAYLRTGYIPSAAAKMALNDAAHGFYVRNASTATNRFLMGGNDGTVAPFGYCAIALTPSPFTNALTNSSNGGATAIYGSGSGMFIAERTDSANHKIIINGAATSSAQASTGRPSIEMYGLGRDTFGTPAGFATDQLAMMFYGQSLGALEPEFRAAILEYLTAIGAN